MRDGGGQISVHNQQDWKTGDHVWFGHVCSDYAAIHAFSTPFVQSVFGLDCFERLLDERESYDEIETPLSKCFVVGSPLLLWKKADRYKYLRRRLKGFHL